MSCTSRYQRIAIAAWAAILAACGAPAPPPASPVPVLVIQPQPAAAASGQAYPGQIHAREEITLSFQVAGKILRREVDAGQQVRQGQRLAQLDVADYALQVQAAQAQWAAAEADLARSRDELTRYTALAEQQLISRSLLDAQTTAFKAAQSQVDAARATLDVARNQARYAALNAPVAGVIATRLAEAGQVVSAGQPVYVLAADGAREVQIALPENAITGVQIGQAVEVEVWNQPGQRWPGQVREIAAAADPASRTWAARVSLPPEAFAALELGQSARVLFTPADTSALQVPLGALQPGASAQETRVWVVDPVHHTVTTRTVIPGTYGSQMVPILDGLDADDWVVAAGGHLLHEHQPVIAVDRHNRPVLTPLTAQEP